MEQFAGLKMERNIDTEEDGSSLMRRIYETEKIFEEPWERMHWVFEINVLVMDVSRGMEGTPCQTSIVFGSGR